LNWRFVVRDGPIVAHRGRSSQRRSESAGSPEVVDFRRSAVAAQPQSGKGKCRRRSVGALAALTAADHHVRRSKAQHDLREVPGGSGIHGYEGLNPEKILVEESFGLQCIDSCAIMAFMGCSTQREETCQENAALRRQFVEIVERNEALRSENAALIKQIAELEALRGENEGLIKQIAELEKLLAQAQRASRRQAAPFRRRKRKKNPKKPGRKKGHPGARRAKPEQIDRTLKAPPLEGCPECGSAVSGQQREENYQTDLPPVASEVTQFEFESGWCSHCEKRVYSCHEEQTSTATGAAAHHLGPRVRALAADLKGRLGIPYRKIVEILREQFGIEVTAGGLAQSNARLAQRASPTLEQMKKALAQEDLVSADETGWRIGIISSWLWVVCSELFTIYVIVPHRCASVVREVLGEDFKGLLMRDGWRSYDAQLSYRMLRCLLHLMHNAEELEDTQSGEAGEAMGLFVLWIEGVFALRQQADELSKQKYQREATAFVEWFDEFVAEEHEESESNRRFARRLGEIRAQVVPIVEDPGLPATNSLGERQIRPAVVHRKISAGNKTQSGAETLSILASLAATCRQQATSFASVVQRILTCPAGQAVIFWQQSDPDPT
jgi:transposase